MDCCCGPSRLVLCHPDSRYGCHVSLQSTLLETVSQLPQCKCIQCYLGGRTAYYCRTVDQADKDATAKYCQEHDKTFYVHCPLVTNLAKPAEADVTRSMETLRACLRQVEGLPAACVLHIGKVGTMEKVAERINRLNEEGLLRRTGLPRTPYTLLLETAAGQGTELGRSWEELRHLFEALDKSCVGLCLDTQHVFASGMSPLQSHDDVVKFFDNANSVTTKGVSLIHLNDSTKTYGSRVDRHAPLRQGHIWYHDDQGLKSLVRIAKDLAVDIVTETSDGNNDLTIIGAY